MLLSVLLIISWRPAAIWVTVYPRYSLPLCPVRAQCRRKSSLHLILLVWSPSPEGTVWMREKRAVWKEQLGAAERSQVVPRNTQEDRAALLWAPGTWRTQSLTPPHIPARPQTSQRVRDSAGEVPAAMQEDSYFSIHFSVDIFFASAEATLWGWLQLLPNFWGKVPSAQGKESIWPTVFISQPGFFQAWQITLLAEEQHKCQVGISKNERFNLSQHREKDLKNTFKCEKIPFVYAQTKQPRGSLTKFQLELKKKSKKISAVIHRRLQAASARCELEPGSSKYLNNQWAPWGPRW